MKVQNYHLELFLPIQTLQDKNKIFVFTLPPFLKPHSCNQMTTVFCLIFEIHY